MARCVNESGKVLLMTEKSEENPPMTCLLISEMEKMPEHWLYYSEIKENIITYINDMTTMR